MSEEEQMRTGAQSRDSVGANKGTYKKNKSGNNPDLPWWVELLFIQIGLPDSWLRSYLKSRKKIRILLSKNPKLIAYGIILIACFCYIEPIVMQSRHHNRCITNSEKYIYKTYFNNKGLDEKELLALANRFCNGGML